MTSSKSSFTAGFACHIKAFLIHLKRSKLMTSFQHWLSKDATNEKSSLIELMVLGALRILGCGWMFDDSDEAMGASEETHHQFFHRFIDFGSAAHCDEHVIMPTTAQMAKNHMAECSEAGFHGGIGSSDATHVVADCISYSVANMHKGPKLAGTA